MQAKVHGPGRLRASFGMVRHDHQMIGWQVPLGSAVPGRHVVLGTQMTFERFECSTVFATDDRILSWQHRPLKIRHPAGFILLFRSSPIP
jgi:hypothetical protein